MDEQTKVLKALKIKIEEKEIVIVKASENAFYHFWEEGPEEFFSMGTLDVIIKRYDINPEVLENYFGRTAPECPYGFTFKADYDRFLDCNFCVIRHFCRR